MEALRKIIRIENSDYDPAFMHVPQDLMQDLTICYKETDAPILLEEGIIFDTDVHGTHIRSPYDDNIYYRIENFERESWRAKIRHISGVARRLGATAVSFSSEIHNKKERKFNFNANANWTLANTSVDFSKEEEATLHSLIEEQQEFDANATIPTQEEYDDAVRYAKKHHIYANAEVQNMLDARNPRESNMLGKRTVHISLCSETNNNLKLAIKIAVPSYGFKTDADFQEAIRFEKSVQIKAEYKFSLKKP